MLAPGMGKIEILAFSAAPFKLTQQRKKSISILLIRDYTRNNV
jgi:hypothetical protein